MASRAFLPHDPTDNPPPPRIPKLKVRGSANTVSPPPSYITIPPRFTRPPLEHRSSSDRSHNTILTSAPTSPRQSLIATRSATPSHDLSDYSPQEDKRSKRGSVLAFLTLKEPSQQAFHEFADLQRKQAALKSVSSAKLTAVSQQKLPADVPRVNSKWDGMPDNAQRDEGWKLSMDSSFLSRHSSKTSTDTSRNTASAHTTSCKSSDSSKRTLRQDTHIASQSVTRDDDALPDLSRLDTLGDSTTDVVPVPSRSIKQSVVSAPVKTLILDAQIHDDTSSIADPSESSPPSSPSTPVNEPFSKQPRVVNPPEPSPILKVQQFRSVDEIPQWPLVTNPADVIILTQEDDDDDDTTTTPHTPTHHRACPVLKAYEVHTPESIEPHIDVESYFPQLNSQPAYPFPDPTSYSAALSQQFPSSFTSPGGRAYRNGVLIPPRRIPGRAVIKDTDLATIPESDTASILNRAPTIRSTNGDRASLVFNDDPYAGRASVAESRPSSEISGQWYQSPRERMGLGGLIKVGGRNNSQWPLPGEEDEDYIVEGSPASPTRESHGYGKAGKGKRTSLMGVFKR